MSLNTNRYVEEVKSVVTIGPTAHSGAANGTAVDTLGFDAAVMKVIAGSIASGATVDCKLQESADGSTGWADISGAAIVQMTDTDDNKPPMVDVLLGGVANRKRYIRAVLTPSGTAPLVGVTIELYRAQNTPVTQVVTPVKVAA